MSGSDTQALSPAGPSGLGTNTSTYILLRSSHLGYRKNILLGNASAMIPHEDNRERHFETTENPAKRQMSP